MTDEWIEKRIRRAGDERLFFIGEAFRRGVTVETIHEWSMIDVFFLRKLEKIVQYETVLRANPFDLRDIAYSETDGFLGCDGC